MSRHTPIGLVLCLLSLSAVQAPAAGPRPSALLPSAEGKVAADVGAIVQSERAFAKLSVEKGQREAFLTFFADDALFFGPEPTNARKVLETWPVESKATLDWEPRFADISADGLLGYTTGPWVRTAKPGQAPATAHGWYFTIWRKHADLRWRVAVDVGIDSVPAGVLRPVAVTAPPRSVPAAAADAKALVAVDESFARLLTSVGSAQAFTSRAGDSVRVYRNGLAPISGPAGARSYFAALGGRYVCGPERADIAGSSDLGYTYGRYRLEGTKEPESGYYFRVWRQQGRAWKVVVDITVPKGRQ